MLNNHTQEIRECYQQAAHCVRQAEAQSNPTVKKHTLARPCDMLPKKRCPASIISFDEYWFVVDGGNGGWEGGAGGGIVSVVWAMPDVDAMTAINVCRRIMAHVRT